MNVLLIDDHFCVREGLSCLLKQQFSDIKTFEAESFEEGMAIANNTPLNLVLLDIQLPGMDGLIGLMELRQAFPNLSVVMFSGFDDRKLVFEALRIGAMGFIPKTMARADFIEALHDVLSGKIFLPASVVSSKINSLPNPHAGGIFRQVLDSGGLGLTAREFEVLGWLVQGKCNKEIARQLGIQEQTVKNHLRPIFQKFGVARRAELMVKVFEMGIAFGRPGVGN